MTRKIFLSLLFALITLNISARIPDNVRVADEVISYRVEARDGKISQVKVEEKQTFEALRSDDASDFVTSVPVLKRI